MIKSLKSIQIQQANCFDFLRFFFAFQILLYHLAVLSQNEKLTILTVFSNANLAVKGFFIISGFLVAKSYLNTTTLKMYFIKRVKRILPAYFFVVFLAALVLFFVSNLSYSEYYCNADLYKYIVWNSMFMNFVHPCLPGVFYNNFMCVVNGSLWTLKVEEGFYLVLPLLFFLIFKIKKTALVLCVIYLLSFLYWYVLDFHFRKPLFAKQLPGYLSYFCTGIFLFIYHQKLFKKKWLYLGLAILVILATYKINVAINVFYPMALGTIIIVAAYTIPIFNNFGKYGDFTYGLYIYHFPIIQIFKQYNLFDKYNPFLMAFCIIIMTFIFAIFSWFCVERRFLDRYKKQCINAS
ncbi:acyltransferase family protein [Flavobacterium ponti]|uniref:Acyltransferase family protein n=1 Tax=Flavobacterium ponti TaxID=665133 RepID=A0ABV9P9U6_9FLAO